jgi:hypothetical protein
MDYYKYHFKRYLSAIFLIPLLLFSFSCRYVKEEKALKEALLWARQDSIRIADSLKRIEIETKVVEALPQDSLGKSDKEKLPGSVGDSRITYYIIAGSFTNPENARLTAEGYRSLGYKTSIINTTNRNGIKAEYVSVNTFNNYYEAVRYLKEFQSKFDSKAWIYSDQ